VEARPNICVVYFTAVQLVKLCERLIYPLIKRLARAEFYLFQAKAAIFLLQFQKCFQAHPAFYQRSNVAYFLSMKRPEHKANHPPQPSVGVISAIIFYVHPNLSAFMPWFLSFPSCFIVYLFIQRPYSNYKNYKMINNRVILNSEMARL
jgi:hypothetical protein